MEPVNNFRCLRCKENPSTVRDTDGNGMTLYNPYCKECSAEYLEECRRKTNPESGDKGTAE